MLSADGTSNLGNEVKPKAKQCLVVWHPGSLPLPPLATPPSHPPNDDGGDESDATTPTTPQRHPHLVAGLPPSAPTTRQIQRTAQELFPSPPPFARIVGSHEQADSVDSGADGRLNRAAGESAAALPRRGAGAVRTARDDARGCAERRAARVHDRGQGCQSSSAGRGRALWRRCSRC
ncbi:hypothetical protein B0H14DRAFT_626686 [Mycena olivaceomarginata]|nr:hypothetical protein B0H14DRAFT_626686 [Mycena olivaceomarginata]